jgi:hypothetical protein
LDIVGIQKGTGKEKISAMHRGKTWHSFTSEINGNAKLETTILNDE